MPDPGNTGETIVHAIVAAGPLIPIWHQRQHPTLCLMELQDTEGKRS